MSIKKTIITTVLTLALVALVAPAVTQADALSDALAQLAQLQAQIAALQGTGTPAGTGACAGVTFTRNLIVGSTGSDVKCLQTILNQKATTKVALTGAGSPGMETTYFGPATLAAVKVYQAEHGFIPANQVGPMTRAALNASLTTTPPPAGGTYPAGCTSTSGYSTTTGLPCSGGVLPAGCTSTSGYSSVTGQPCSGTPGTPGVATEGFITISTLAATPASNANVTTTSNIPVLGVNIKAVNSNETVGSVKLQLAVTKSSVAEHPATLIQKLYVYDGTTLLASYPVTTDSVIKTGSDYYMILTGTNFMIPAGQTKALTISADFNAGLETDRVLTVNLYGTDAVRGTDTLGINSTAGLTTTRAYTIKYSTVGGSTLVATANTGTPISTSVNVDTTDGVQDVPMFVFNAKSTVGASKITDLVFTATGDNAAVAKLTAVKLYDGLTLLGSQSLSSAVSGATATFTDLAIPVAKDATKTLLVRADFASGVTPATKVNLSIDDPSADVTYEKPDLSTGHPASSTTIAGKDMYLFDGEAAVVTFVSGASTYTVPTDAPTDGYTTGVITLKVKADGGTMTEPVSGDFVVNSYTDGSSNGAVSSINVTVTPNTDVPDGSEATVVINVSETLTNTGSGFVNFKVESIDWEVGATTATQTWGLDDFKTNASNAQ